MKIYPKQSKSLRESGNYYFGDYGEIPMGISCTTIDENNENETRDQLHYHKISNEFYITLEGEGILEVEGKEIILKQDSMVMIQPGERHKIIKATVKPFRFIAISTEKNKEDKIIIEE